MNAESFTRIRRSLKEQGAFRIRTMFGVLTVVFELSVFSVLVAGLAGTEPFTMPYWGLQIVLATSLYRLFVILHECGHGTLFQKRVSNTLVGSFVSPLCLLPYVPWRNIHFLHHKWVGVIDKDPTQAELLKLERLSGIERLLFRVFWKLMIPVPFMKFVIDCFWKYPLNEWRAGRSRHLLTGALSILVAGVPHGVLLSVIGPRLYLTRFGPAIVLYYVIFELVNLVQHSGLFPYLSDSHPNAIPLREQDSITRSSRVPRWLGFVLFYNFNLHSEHHLFPMLPWYALPQATQPLREAADADYIDVGLLRFAWQLRTSDPIELYLESLPKPFGHDDAAAKRSCDVAVISCGLPITTPGNAAVTGGDQC